ncbi:unnamed protein product [Moneuplotes crassus]|uniref:Uncharacterized protein n=1 Tax=Euplotes crassus TaxID=5936 RepID=A0AAD1UKV1_EUPCR|nr:unnamed protein product [Moneuplotes crassus]
MKEILIRDPKLVPSPKNMVENLSQKKSLNCDFRKKELERITLENYQILQRLRTKKSNYSNQKWEVDHKRKLLMKQRISNFKGKNIEASASVKRLPQGQRKYKIFINNKMFPRSRNLNSLPRIEEGKYKFQSHDTRFGNHSRENMSSHQSQQTLQTQYVSPIDFQAKLSPMKITGANINVENKRKIIYRKIHKYQNKTYLIEIGKTKTKYFIVAIELSKQQKIQAKEIHAKQAKKLIKNCGGIDHFANNIDFKFGKIVIKNMDKLLIQTLQPLPFDNFSDKRRVVIKSYEEGKVHYNCQ